MTGFFTKGRRALCLMLALAITVCAALTAGSAKEVLPRRTLYSGDFTLFSSDKTGSAEKYFYSDTYFEQSGKIFNEHLRTVSAALSFSLCDMARENGVNRSILSRIGFSDIEMYDMDRTAADTIGTVIAKKNIGGSVVVALMLRGYDYDNEWASNFLCGGTGDAAGFASCAQKAEERLLSYLDAKHIRSAKIWITGYSRSAAAANLVGKALNEQYDVFHISEDDIYVYTFEAPNCSSDDTPYENIHNTVDRCDLVTYVYPRGWGLSRCGAEEYIGDADRTIMSRRMNLFAANMMSKYKEVSLSVFLNEYFEFLTQYVSREKYAGELESDISAFADIYFDLDQEEQDQFSVYLERFLIDFLVDENNFSVILSLVDENAGEPQFMAFADLIINNMDKASGEVINPLSDEDYLTLKSAVRKSVIVLIPALKADLQYSVKEPDGSETKVPLYYLMTLIGNFEEIIQYHMDTSVFEHLKAADSYYTGSDLQRIGDSDGDGEVTVLDATAIQKSLARMYDLGESRRNVADADYDHAITVLDATSIQKYLAGMGNPYRINDFLLD